MFCTRCGIQMSDLDKFCSQCGNLAPGPASANASTASAAASVQPPATTVTYTIEPQPQLTRSLRNRKIAGVCAGIGRHFGVDPTVVRVLFLAMFFCPVLPAFIPYIVCWVVMPLERPEPLPQQPQQPYYGRQPLAQMSR